MGVMSDASILVAARPLCRKAVKDGQHILVVFRVRAPRSGEQQTVSQWLISEEFVVQKALVIWHDRCPPNVMKTAQCDEECYR
jgi:hypothetical protein